MAKLFRMGRVPLIISLEKMDAVRAIYPQENVLIVEAGATLADVRKVAKDVGRLFPVIISV